MESVPFYLISVDMLRKPMGYVEEDWNHVTCFNVDGTEAQVLGLDKFIRHPTLATNQEKCTITTRGDTFQFEVPSIYLELLAIRSAHVDVLQFQLNEASLFATAAKDKIDEQKKEFEKANIALKTKQIERSKQLVAKVQVAQSENKVIKNELVKKMAQIKNLKANFAWVIKQLKIKEWTIGVAGALSHWAYITKQNKQKLLREQSSTDKQNEMFYEAKTKSSVLSISKRIYAKVNAASTKQKIFSQWSRLLDFRNTEAYLTVESCFRSTIIQTVPSLNLMELLSIEELFLSLSSEQQCSIVLAQEAFTHSFVFKCVMEVGNRYYPSVNADRAYNMILKDCKEKSGFDNCQAQSDFSDWVVVREYFCLLAKYTLRNLYDYKDDDKDLVYYKLYMFRPYFQQVVTDEQISLEHRLKDLQKLQNEMNSL